MTQIKLPETFVARCEDARLNPQETAKEILSAWEPKGEDTTGRPIKPVLQNFIPTLVQALKDAINTHEGTFRAKYYPPPNGNNTLWFNLNSAMDWWLLNQGQKLNSRWLKKELRRFDYTAGPKAVKIQSKATWCYGFRQPLDTPILPLQGSHDFLEWTKTSAPRD